MTLISLPDVCKKNPGLFTTGKDYEILGTLGNCVIIVNDKGEKAAVLAERLA